MVIKILLFGFGLLIIILFVVFLFLFVAGSDESRKGIQFDDEEYNLDSELNHDKS